MTDSLAALAEAIEAAHRIWHDDAPASLAPGALVAVNDQLGKARRLLDAAHAQVAAEIARQSRPELGADSLAKTQGFRNPAALIAATTGTSTGEASRLVQVGDAVAPRMSLIGETMPAKHPFVAEALAAGRIGASAAGAIIALLDKVALRAGRERIDEAEKLLTSKAAGLSHNDLTKLLVRAEAWLDPDGVAPREDELRAQVSVTMREERSGMFTLAAALDPEHAAPVKVAIEGLVTSLMRTQRDEPDAPRRSVKQMQAEALAIIARHYLACDGKELPVEGATLVVRMTLQDLVGESDGSCDAEPSTAGPGYATIDGITTPISVETARRMAAGGRIIPMVLGGESEILDWGRAKRLFTQAQKLALVERDGGCVGCGAPPSHTRVHHIRWWARDGGMTDLDNGVLLCESCHHRVHDNGWDIRIDGAGVRARVWLIPPPHVDPTRTPRRAGRAKFDLVA